MYTNLIGDLYIGKSKLSFAKDHPLGYVTYLPPTEIVRSLGKDISHILYPYDPDYAIEGTLTKDHNFILTYHPVHCLYITGIPKNGDLELYRLKNTVWSSYYEDEKRGYLFQVVLKSDKIIHTTTLQ